MTVGDPKFDSHVALRSEIEILRAGVAQVAAMFFVLDAEGRFLVSEGRLLDKIGRRPGDDVGKLVFDICTDAPHFLASCRRALTGEDFTVVTPMRFNYLEIRFTPFVDDRGREAGTVAIGVDVTERERAAREDRRSAHAAPLPTETASLEQVERALRDAEEQYRSIFASTSIGMAVLSADEKLVDVNPAICEMLGYTRIELLELSPTELVVDEFRDGYRQALRDVFASRSWAGPSAGKRKDGTVVQLHVDATSCAFKGEPHLLVCMRDAGSERATEEALDREHSAERRVAALSREFLSLRADEIDAAVSAALEATGELAGADRAWLVDLREHAWDSAHLVRWFRRDEEVGPLDLSWALPELSIGQTVHAPRASTLMEGDPLFQRAVAERATHSVLALPMRTGQRLVGALVFEAVRRPRAWTDHELALLGVVADVFASTLARESAEVALASSRDQLLQGQKMEAVGRMAGSIAHAFNNVLTVVIGCAETLRETQKEREPREDVEEILRASGRASKLTSQLLAFSRPDPSPATRLDPNEEVRNYSETLQNAVGEDVRVELDLDDACEAVAGDPHQLDEVLLQLAANARDAMPEGGTLQISSWPETVDDDEAVRLGLSEAGDYVVISVEDNGQGMDEQTCSRVFEPFFTTRGEVASGLGLSVVYGIVKQWRGAVTLRSAVTHGTTVDVYLPSHADEKKDVPRYESHAPRTVGVGTVLLVEDERGVRRVVRRLLRRAGYDVVEAEDGLEALELVKGRLRDIDLVITDVVMPRMGGVKLVETLKDERASVRVLFLSGYPDDRGAGLGDALPGHFLTKPFTKDGLLEAVREAIED